MCHMSQKRPTTYLEARSAASDLGPTYYIAKRDLLHRQKRPTTKPKETYYKAKRDLLRSQKRPTT